MDDYDYEEMVQRIASNKHVLWYLKLFYIDEIFENSFQEELVESQSLHSVSEDEADAIAIGAYAAGIRSKKQVIKQDLGFDWS